jgi:hypothetical protein
MDDVIQGTIYVYGHPSQIDVEPQVCEYQIISQGTLLVMLPEWMAAGLEHNLHSLLPLGDSDNQLQCIGTAI